MAKKCSIAGKGPLVGNNVSHANNKVKRRWLPNMQTKRFYDEETGRWTPRIRVSAKGIRIIDKHGISAVLADPKLRNQIEN